MTANPYQSPSISSLDSHPELSMDSTGVSLKDYLQFRRAAALLATTTATFFLLFSIQMVQDSMLVEAAIASGFWITMLACARGILIRRTAYEAELTLKKYRAIASSMRQLSLWLGPLMLVVGILQVTYVPAVFQLNPWGFVVCGVAAFCGSFQWPRVRRRDEMAPLESDT